MPLRKISSAFNPPGISGILPFNTLQPWQFETSAWNLLMKSAPWPFMFNKVVMLFILSPNRTLAARALRVNFFLIYPHGEMTHNMLLFRALET